MDRNNYKGNKYKNYNKPDSNIRDVLDHKLNELIDDNARIYYFDEIIKRGVSQKSLSSTLKNSENNDKLKLFIEYIEKNIEVKNELQSYLKRMPKIFRHEESVEVDYFKNNVISIDEDYDMFLNNVKGYAYILIKNGMTTSQIRNVYSDVLRTAEVKNLKKLRPKFAYIAGRNSKEFVIRFMDLLDYLVKSMQEESGKEQLENFKAFLEAIVAYMKYFGDKN